MPVEKDDEATTFDPKPWGAMQRILPSARFAKIRTSGPLQAASVATIVPLPFALPALPVPVAQRPITAFNPAPAYPQRVPLTLALTIDSPLDTTMPVRRRPLTARSLIAAPIGAVFAAIIIVIAMAGTGKRGSAPASVRLQTVDQPALPVLAPLPAPPASELAAAVAAEAETDETQAEPEADFVILDDEPAPAASSSKRAGKRVRGKRPRKIVAVDSSTPLGNLRPRRF